MATDESKYIDEAEALSLIISSLSAQIPRLRAYLNQFAGVVPIAAPANKVLGAPLNNLIYEGGPGTYTTPTTTITTTANLTRFYWDGTTWTSLEVPVAFNASGYTKVADFLGLQNSAVVKVASTFFGKTIFCLGDSFTELQIYQPALVSQLGAIVQSDGIGGSCITGGTALAEGDGRARTPIVDRIDSALATNPAAIVIEGSSNDWYYNTPMGDITSTDRNTFYGAWKEIIVKCVAKTYPILIVPVTMMQRGGTVKGGSVSGRANYADQFARAKAVVDVCSMYGVEVCNVFNEVGITYENIAVYTSDNVHPDKAAGKEKYGSFIANFIYKKGFVQTFGYAPAVTNEPVVWTNLQAGTIVSGNTVKMDNGQGTGWCGGANANKRFVSGDASVDLPANVGDAFVVGLMGGTLTPSTPVGNLLPGGNLTYIQLRYGAYYNGAIFRVFESGNKVYEIASSGAISISVKIESGVVNYYLAGQKVYSSGSLNLSYPIYPAIAMGQTTATPVAVSGATITGNANYY